MNGWEIVGFVGMFCVLFSAVFLTAFVLHYVFVGRYEEERPGYIEDEFRHGGRWHG